MDGDVAVGGTAVDGEGEAGVDGEDRVDGETAVDAPPPPRPDGPPEVDCATAGTVANPTATAKAVIPRIFFMSTKRRAGRRVPLGIGPVAAINRKLSRSCRPRWCNATCATRQPDTGRQLGASREPCPPI